MERVILHCDANAFYASVECLYTPSIRHSPVAVSYTHLDVYKRQRWTCHTKRSSKTWTAPARACGWRWCAARTKHGRRTLRRWSPGRCV